MDISNSHNAPDDTAQQNVTTPALTIPAEAFRRADETPDEDFYRMPRLVTHIDDAAIGAVTQLYRKYFPPGGAILDLMSSWISHLPPDIAYSHVTGLGMNQTELDANPRLNERLIQNLNTNARLPFGDNLFDGAGLCVSIDYLTDPIRVVRETGRVLKPDAPFVVTFSNRCFPTKAIAIWHHLDDRGRIALVQHFFEAAGSFTDIQALDCSSRPRRGDPLYAVVGRKKNA